LILIHSIFYSSHNNQAKEFFDKLKFRTTTKGWKNMSRRASNKKQKAPPRSFLENESLSSVVGFPTEKLEPGATIIINTPVASAVTKEIFFERFEKEIIQPFEFRFQSKSKSKEAGQYAVVNGKLQRRPRTTKNDTASSKETPRHEDATTGTSRESSSSAASTKRKLLKTRLLVGTNQCSRALEAAQAGTSLIPLLMVLSRDIYPPTMLAHAPVLARKLSIPLLLLPGKASSELGKALGTKKTSIMLFLPSKESGDALRAIDSFIEFVIQQIPKEEEESLSIEKS
jgi:ribosomal protein L7Ae-like RNA K-turn-binding protein